MKKVIEFLTANNLTTIATSANNQPRASIVEYYMVGNSLIFATQPGSIKANNISQNKQVSLSIQNMPKFVTLDGLIETPTASEINSYSEQLYAIHPEFKEMLEKGIMNFIYFKVAIKTAYFNDYTEGMKPTEVFKA